MADVIIDIGGEIFEAFYETKDAPKTVARFRDFVPYSNRIIHVRWSGEACWIPMGDFDLGLGFENAPSYPAPGQVTLEPCLAQRRILTVPSIEKGICALI